MQKTKSGKATGPPEVSVEIIVASGEIRVKVMMELCQRVLDGRGIPDWMERRIGWCIGWRGEYEYSST